MTLHGRQLPIRAAAATTIGRVRPANEDRSLSDASIGLHAVADGVGGLPFGERASEEAIRFLSAAAAADPLGRTPLADMVRRAHGSVRDLGRMLSPHTGIGTTLTAVRLRGFECEIAHVGDSQAYLLETPDGAVRMLTTDHTVPAPRVELLPGSLSDFQPPPRLDRYLGRPVEPDCDTLLLTLKAGNRLILCTDGVTRSLERWELAALSRVHAEPSGLARALVGIADSRGGLDNATVVVIDVLEPGVGTPPPPNRHENPLP